jgi:ribosome biogenesis GTPase A
LDPCQYEQLENLLVQSIAILEDIPLAPDAARMQEILNHYQEGLLVLIIGEFSSGKSSFINAFLGESVVTTSIIPETVTINVIRYGDQPKTTITYRDGQRREVSDLIADDSYKQDANQIVEIELIRPIEKLEEFSLVDTPGLNSIFEEHETTTRNYLHKADVVIWLFDALKMGKLQEKRYLEFVREYSPKLLGVINKVDLVQEPDRQILLNFLTEHFPGIFQRVFLISARQNSKPSNIRLPENVGSIEDYIAAEIVPAKQQIKQSYAGKNISRILTGTVSFLEQGRRDLIQKKDLIHEVENLLKNISSNVQRQLSSVMDMELKNFFTERQEQLKAFVKRELTMKRALQYTSQPINSAAAFQQEVIGEAILTAWTKKLSVRLEKALQEAYGQRLKGQTLTNRLIFPSFRPAFGEDFEKLTNLIYFETVEKILATGFMFVVLIIVVLAFWSWSLAVGFPLVAVCLGFLFAKFSLFRYRRDVMKRFSARLAEYQIFLREKMVQIVQAAEVQLFEEAINAAHVEILGFNLGSGEWEARLSKVERSIADLTNIKNAAEELCND